MKTIITKRGLSGKNSYTVKQNYSLWLTLFLSVFCITMTSAQNSSETITIYANALTYPLIEKWTTEYTQSHPEITFSITRDSQKNNIDLKAGNMNSAISDSLNTRKIAYVGRYMILPIINGKNTQFNNILKKGISRNELGEIFITQPAEMFDEKKSDFENLRVYIKPGLSNSSGVFAGYLHCNANDLSGIIVAGDEKYLTAAVLKDSIGISYNHLGFIYDLTSRTPLDGLSILPIDLNNNGYFDKNEKVFANLDQLLSFLEKSEVDQLPVESIGLAYSLEGSTLPEINDFVKWVITNGQLFNHTYGFLHIAGDDTPTLTLK